MTLPVVVVAGPTASGKSALASALAERFDGVVVNADSMQLYHELDILSDRPGPEALARAPHALYGVVAARVVLNERTGTVVMGANVRIATVAVAHGNLSVTIGVVREASQPNAFGGGETVVVENEFPVAVEEAANLSVVEGPVTIAELVRGLNAMGVTPRDLIAILQAIKASGALAADLELL